MKLIEAIIKPVKLEEVETALEGLGVDDYLESVIVSHGRVKGQSIVYRGVECVTNVVEKVKLEIFAADDAVGKIIEVIGKIARTDRMEDCRIFVVPYCEAN
jgi:nitrogen regulatory protein P-II 1